MPKPLIVVVNEKNEIIGAKPRRGLAPGDIYRVSALWCTNSEGGVLMAQRAFTKDKDPGKWGPACAGTVEEGETFEENMVKETGEELGLSITPEQLKIGPLILVKNIPNTYYCQWYFYTIDKPAESFQIQVEEVEQIHWFGKQELKKQITEHPEEFTYAAPQWANLFL